MGQTVTAAGPAPVLSIDTWPAVKVSPGVGDQDVVGLLVGLEGPAPEALGVDREALQRAGFDGETGSALAAATALARDLANSPHNHLSASGSLTWRRTSAPAEAWTSRCPASRSCSNSVAVGSSASTQAAPSLRG